MSYHVLSRLPTAGRQTQTLTVDLRSAAGCWTPTLHQTRRRSPWLQVHVHVIIQTTVSCAASGSGRLTANLAVPPAAAGACGVRTAVAMAWVEEKLHASDLIRQLSGADDAQTKSVGRGSPTVSIDLELCSAVNPTDTCRLTRLRCALLGLVFAMWCVLAPTNRRIGKLPALQKAAGRIQPALHSGAIAALRTSRLNRGAGSLVDRLQKRQL